MTRLAAGDPGRWAELAEILATFPDRWQYLVWSAIEPASIPAFRRVLAGLPRGTVRAILDSIGSRGAPAELADLFADPDLATDRGAMAFFVHHPDDPDLPWDRVATIASQTTWSSEWCDAVTLIADRDAAGLPTGGDPNQLETLARLRRGYMRPEAEPIDRLGLVATLLSTSVDPSARGSALDQLLTLSPNTATDLLVELSDDPVFTAAATTFAAHPEPGAVEAALVRCGLIEPSGRPDRLVLPIRLLREQGLTVRFSAETDMYPNRYDALLASLASPVPELARLTFEEIPPPADDEPPAPEQLADAYRLRVWDGERCWELVAGDTSDWYDVPATVGLLNAVARDLAVPHRFVELPEDGGHTEVLVAPGDAIARAMAESLLPLQVDPPDGVVARELSEEARRRYGERREIEVQRDPTGVWEVVWFRAVVALPADPECEISVAEATAIGGEDWRPGDTIGVLLPPWW